MKSEMIRQALEALLGKEETRTLLAATSGNGSVKTEQLRSEQAIWI